MNVTVIGGGPAGSLAAILLARRGAAVTLIEQHRFPRDKVCGECLSALGRDVLKRHGLEAGLLPAGRELRRAILFSTSTSVTFDLPQPMLGVSRALLDATLLNAAAAAGATIRQPARAEHVMGSCESAEIQIRDLKTNAVDTTVADYVLLADGRAAFVRPRPALTGDLGVKAHFANVSADAAAITLYGGLGCYGGVAPIEGDRWNVAFSVPRTNVAAFLGDFDAWWADLSKRSDGIRRHFGNAQRLSPWLASPLPRFTPQKTWADRVIPIGASAGAIEPVGGEGMGTALRSAELAVEAILTDRLHALPAAFSTLWSRRGFFCRLGGQMLADEAWSDGIAMTGASHVRRAALWLIGK